MQFWKQNGKLLLLVLVVILLGWLALTLAAPPAAAGPQTAQAVNLSWNVVANGGSTMSSTSYTIVSTSGQPVAAESASGSYSMISGYWAGLRAFISDVFLPAVYGV